MPGIGCLGEFYIRCPGNRKIGIFRFPEIRTFGDSLFGKSENLDFQISGKSGFSEIRKSENLKIRIFGFPEIQILGNRISETPENPKLRIFRYSDFPFFSENRKIQKFGKKASDVDFAHVEFPLQSMVVKGS